MIEDSIKDSKLYLSISVSRTEIAHQPYALQVAGEGKEAVMCAVMCLTAKSGCSAVTLLQKAAASAVTLLLSVLVCVLALSSSNSRKLILRSSHTEFEIVNGLLSVVIWLFF
jgi:hypothetical protein